MNLYSPDHPCRCGYDGEGAHQCHAGRHPDYPGERCPNEAVARFVSKRIGTFSLAGCQLKTIGNFGHYCATCWIEAGFPPVKEERRA